MNRWLEEELDLPALGRCLLALLPLLLLGLGSGNTQWQHALIVASATLVGVERVDLALPGVIAQTLLILICFIALLLAQSMPLLFILNCAVLAALSLALTARGSRLRSLGTFIFVPALYLACDAAPQVAAPRYLQLILAWLPYLLAGALPVMLLSLFLPSQSESHRRPWCWRPQLRRHPHAALGTSMVATLPTLTAGVAVAAAATVVILFHPDNPQWLIWSAASVVTTDRLSSQHKLRDRLLGAAAGVPAGILLALLLPPYPALGLLLCACSCCTIFLFKRYQLSFAIRSLCAACAVVIAHQSLSQAGGRLVEVALGGLIGLIFTIALYTLFNQRLLQRQEPANENTNNQ